MVVHHFLPFSIIDKYINDRSAKLESLNNSQSILKLNFFGFFKWVAMVMLKVGERWPQQQVKGSCSVKAMENEKRFRCSHIFMTSGYF